MKLLTTSSHVECPFIILTIGKWTFGNYNKSTSKNMYGENTTVTFPNMMKSLTVDKVNGTVNTYTIVLEYGIAPGEDPNLLERVFSSISDSRKIVISYGDWNQPAFIYKEEEAIVTKVTTNMDFGSSKLEYTVTAVSNSASIKSTLWNFGASKRKPSDIIIQLLKDKSYKLQEVFTGMKDVDTVLKRGLIATDDRPVEIHAKQHINILDYLSYLVSCMTCVTNTGTNTIINDSIYHLAIYDDISKEYEGTYFKVVKIPGNTKNLDDMDVFEVDVGYPTDNFVTKFQVSTNDNWSILYKFAMENQNNYTYQLDKNGKIIGDNLPQIYYDKISGEVEPDIVNWWTQVTEYPISATLEIKGLLRPAMLMQYVRINSYFYGQKYIASGLYIITKQTDTVNSNGYKTTFTLQRIGKDVL